MMDVSIALSIIVTINKVMACPNCFPVHTRDSMPAMLKHTKAKVTMDSQEDEHVSQTYS